VRRWLRRMRPLPLAARGRGGEGRREPDGGRGFGDGGIGDGAQLPLLLLLLAVALLALAHAPRHRRIRVPTAAATSTSASTNETTSSTVFVLGGVAHGRRRRAKVPPAPPRGPVAVAAVKVRGVRLQGTVPGRGHRRWRQLVGQGVDGGLLLVGPLQRPRLSPVAAPVLRKGPLPLRAPVPPLLPAWGAHSHSSSSSSSSSSSTAATGIP
jgi:hypothetical protein